MKSPIILAALLAGLMAFSPTQAQVNVNVNIGAQPLWGPVGYDYVEFYYLPQYDVYYYVPTAQFVYFSRGRWVYASSLPLRYGRADLYRTYKVVINQPHAYHRHHSHKTQYAKFRDNPTRQVVIRDSRDPKYTVIKGHPHGSQNKSKAAPDKGKGKPGKGRKR